MFLKLEWSEIEEAITDWLEKNHPTVAPNDATAWQFEDENGSDVDVNRVTIPAVKKVEN